MPLIDTKKAWKTAQRIYSDPVLLHAIKNTLECAPTVEAVEVVRCKDCKYCFSDERGLWCFRDYEIDLKPDDFCSSGEKEVCQCD